MRNLTDVWLKPLEWFDLQTYHDGTPATKEDRIIYAILSAFLLLVILAIAALIIGVIF